MKYWTLFAAKRLDAAYKEVESHTILDEIFAYTKIQELIDAIIGDYPYPLNTGKTKRLLCRSVISGPCTMPLPSVAG